MSFLLNSRIALSVATIAAASALIVGATFAYFSDNATSNGNVLASGTLTVEITDQNANTPFAGEAIISNWAPGDDALVNFDVKNTGSIPANIRGFATGTWGVPELDDQNMVKVTKVERWNGASWEELASSPPDITGLFYYSPDGTNTALLAVNAGDRAQFQLTVEFDEDAGNDFQTQSFTSSLQVEAKQTNDLVSWP